MASKICCSAIRIYFYNMNFMQCSGRKGSHLHIQHLHLHAFNAVSIYREPPKWEDPTVTIAPSCRFFCPKEFFLPETNSAFAPENGWLELLLGKAYFQGRFLVDILPKSFNPITFYTLKVASIQGWCPNNREMNIYTMQIATTKLLTCAQCPN